MKRTTIYLEEKLIKQLKIHCVQTGIPMSSFITAAIIDKLGSKDILAKVDTASSTFSRQKGETFSTLDLTNDFHPVPKKKK